MQYRKLGRSGLKISSVSIGGWLTYGGSMDQEPSLAVLRRAIERGINFVDLADIYSLGRAEEFSGRLLREVRRQDLVISSKVFWPMSENVNDRGLSRKHIFESVNASLKRLGTDYLDLYFAHRYDDETPLDETMRAMDDLVRQGKVLYWGTSLWPAGRIKQAMDMAVENGWYAPTVEQPRYNLIDREIEPAVLPTCRSYGLGVVVWSPLAQGFLTGKYNDGTRPVGSRGAESQWLDRVLGEPRFLAGARTLAAIAKERFNVTPGQLALAWLLHQPGIISVITGATNPSQVDENVAAADIALDAATVAELRALF
jgi:voltage-dependent potassium channel beta subunit